MRIFQPGTKSRNVMVGLRVAIASRIRSERHVLSTEPLAKGGYLKLPETGVVVGIEQIQLEQVIFCFYETPRRQL